MPRSTRNRSSSPQKMATQAGTDNLSETKRKERDKLYQEIQEMFQDTIDHEVVHLVLTECEWRVDEAIETLFAMSQDELSEKKVVSKSTDLDVIACSLIGEVESHHKHHATSNMEKNRITNNNEPVLQPLENLDPVEMVLSRNLSDPPEKETEKLVQDLLTSESPSFPGDMSNVEYQTYVDMYNVYGTYVPEIMESIKLKDEPLKNSQDIKSSLSQSDEGDSVILSPTSGISNIGLLDPICLQKSNKCHGNRNSCPSDKLYVDTAPHTLSLYSSDTVSTGHKAVHTLLAEDTKISQMDTFGPLKGKKSILAQDSGKASSKGGNSNTLGPLQKQSAKSDVSIGAFTDNGDTTLRDGGTTLRDGGDASVGESDQDMFSATHNKREDKGHSDLISMAPLSVEAAVFVPRLASTQPPPGLSQWVPARQLEGNPIFMTPKGLHPRSRLSPKHYPNRSPGLPHSRWQRPSTHPTQPKPLQPLSSMAAQNPYKFSGSVLQAIPPPPSSDHFPTMPERSIGPVRQVQGSNASQMIYSKAAAKPVPTPDWATQPTSHSIPASNNQVISCAEQIEQVKTYMVKGRQLLVILRGLPGSGKTYLAREIVFDGAILSTDDYFLHCGEYRYNQDQLTEAHTWNKQRACDAMERHVSPVIIDNTNTMDWEMVPYVKMAVARGYDVEVLEPSTPWKFHPKVLAKRNSHGVGRDAIRKMNQRYQHNVTAAGLLARISQHNSIKESADARDGSPLKPQKEGVKTSVRLVQYDLSSEEEQEDVMKVPPQGKAPVCLTPMSIKQGTMPLTPKVLKLNLNIKKPMTNKQVKESGSAPGSPKKRKRKKRKASSSKSEVMQTIEEIFQSCGEGEIDEGEIQALLFMSPLSEAEKQDIQVWLQVKLDHRKNISSVPIREDPIAKVVEDIQNEGCMMNSCDSLEKELNDIAPTELTAAVVKAKSVVTTCREGVGIENMSDLRKPSYEGEDDAEARMTTLDVDARDNCDNEPWSQNHTGPKPRRYRPRRRSQNLRENADQNDSTLEKEKDYTTEAEISEQQTQFSISMEGFKRDEKEVDETETVDVLAVWGVPRPDGEQFNPSNTGGRSKGETTADASKVEILEGVRAVNQEVITEVDEMTSRDFVREDVEAIAEVKKKVSVSGSDGQKTGDGNEAVPAEVTDIEHTKCIGQCLEPSEKIGDTSEDSEEAFESFDSDEFEVICGETGANRKLACDQRDEKDINKEEKHDDSFLSLSVSSREEDDGLRAVDTSVATSVADDEMEVGQEDHQPLVHVVSRQNDIQDSWCHRQETKDENETSNETEAFYPCEPNEDSLIVKLEDTSTVAKVDIACASSEVSRLKTCNEKGNFGNNNSDENDDPDKQLCETITGHCNSTNMDMAPMLKGNNTITILGADLKKSHEDSLIQKTPIPKKSKTVRKKQENVVFQFLDDDSKQKFQTESWSSFGLTTPAQPSASRVSDMQKSEPKGRKVACRSHYSFTSSKDFAFMTDINCNKPLHQIKDSKLYTVLLGKSRDINFEKTQRMKTISHSSREERKHDSLTLDKGCMTDEKDLQVPADVEFLVKAFPGAEENHLRDALDICQGNVEWTVNLLLDWGESVPFSSVDKEEISTQMKQKTPDKTIKLAKQALGTKSPLSLFDLCQKAIEANSLASNDELQDKVIKTGYQRLQRMESHSMMRVRSFSQSESSLANDSLLSDIIQDSSSVLSDVYISPDKLRSPTERQLPSPVQDMGASTEGDWGVEEDWSEEDRCVLEGDAHVTLPVPEELVRDLEELFGPVQSSLTGCESFEVTLDMRTAKRLFENLQRRPASRGAHIRQQSEEFRKQDEFRRQSEERSREKQLREDEALARKLQQEENHGPHQGKETPSSILRNVKSAQLFEPPGFRQQGSGTHVISRRRTAPTYNLMDIMKEEEANQQRREEQLRVLDATGDRMAISTKLKRQKLYNQFPGVDENFLEEIFEANGFSLEETVDVLREAVGKTRSPRQVGTFAQHNMRDDDHKENAKKKSLQDLVDQSWQQQQHPSGTSEYQDGAGGMDYDNIRGEANIHHKMRNECFQKAQEAFRRGMKDVASFYSQQGHLHTCKLKEANMRASQKIMEHRTSLMQQGTLDLHGFHVDEAVAILKSVIEDREIDLQARPDRRKQSLFVITGRGRHSRGGVAKLRPAIISHLNNMNYRYMEQQPGLFKIFLQYRA